MVSNKDVSEAWPSERQLALARASDTRFNRSVFRHAQRLPIARFEMFREIDDLADVISVVRELAIDCLDNGMILSANSDCAH